MECIIVTVGDHNKATSSYKCYKIWNEGVEKSDLPFRILNIQKYLLKKGGFKMPMKISHFQHHYWWTI
jgi:hypothetical protein